MTSKSRLIIVDLSSFIFRAFYAIRMLNSPEGVPVNAVHGVLGMLLKLISDYRPTHMFIARDSKGASFRKELYSEYKANRSEPPEELIPQFDIIKELVEKMGLISLEKETYEADDVIGSVAVQWKDQFDEILIASSDKDLMQFVDKNVKMLDTMKDKIYDRNSVFEKMGVWPEQIVDYLSILGDASDNIPGMKGIGAKGASKLLAEHQTLDGCIAAKATYTNKRVKNAFENHLEDAHLSKKLIEIVTDIQLEADKEETRIEFTPTDELIDFLKNLGFKTVLKKLKDMKYGEYQAKVNDGNLESKIFKATEKKFQHHEIKSIKELKDLLEEKEIAIFFKYPEKVLHSLDLLESLSVSSNGKNSFYYYFADEDISTKKKILETIVLKKDLKLISFDTKTDMVAMIKEEIDFRSDFYDILQAYYNLDTGGSRKIDFITKKYLGYDLVSEDFISDYNSTKEFEIVYLGERACSVYKLKQKLDEELKKQDLGKVYQEIDKPLIPVLAKMEKTGILLNKGFLSKLEIEFSKESRMVEEEINSITNFPVNLKSPKQVAELLFEHLNLPIIKKTKTGASTDMEVLQELDTMGESSVPGLIMKYRELEKLLSTYVKVLPEMVNPKTGRLHTHFYQNSVSTGRLSSDKPNLQNIPVRSENGKLIRKGFMAKPGWLLLSADYSQIELRLLAHFSEDQVMVDAFNHDLDIHAQTASEVTGLSLDKVTYKERSMAKTVNFGLMYGQSSFGLAKTLGISRREAKDYITQYFARFSRVKSFLDELKEMANEKGYSETLHGRKRFLPDLNNQNRMVKAMAERLAVNSPIQGTAADIIKLAMINLDKRLKEGELESKMLLQVHDELIFEVPESELDTMMLLIRSEMEDVVDLKVPLKVDMGIGVNWYDIK